MTRPPLYLCVTFLSHFFNLLCLCFTIECIMLPGRYLFINKLFLIDPLQSCGVMLGSAKLCQHSAVLSCGLYKRLSVYVGQRSVFFCICEILRWQACCSLVQWFSEFGCPNSLSPSSFYSELFGCPLYLVWFRFPICGSSKGGEHMCGADVLSCMVAARPAPSHLTSSHCHVENQYL